MGKCKDVFSRVLSDYKSRARKRGIEFKLTRAEIEAFIVRDCFYCQKPPANKYKDFRAYTGIDRIDNNKGYTPDNIVACCRECNQLKSNQLSLREMLIVAAVLRAFRQTS